MIVTILISTYRVAFATYLLSIACFVLNVRWGAIYMLITGLQLHSRFVLWNTMIYGYQLPEWFSYTAWQLKFCDAPSLPLLAGLLLLLSCLTYGVTIINDPPLTIHFSDGTLSPQFNWAFWLVLCTGFLSTEAALTIIFIDLKWPWKTAEFFHHSRIVDNTMFEVRQPIYHLQTHSVTSCHSAENHTGLIQFELPRNKIVHSIWKKGQNCKILKHISPH